MVKIVENLFISWNKENIKYCHWKSNEHLEEGLDGITDLDILVDILNKEVAERILLENNFLKFFPQFGSRYKMVDEWLGLDEITGKLIHVHLHYRMITGHKGLKEYHLPWDEIALSTSIKDEKYNLINIVEPNLEIIILYTRIALKISSIKKVKILLNKYKLDEDTKKEIEYLKEHIENDKVKLILQEYYGKYSEEFYKIIFAPELDCKKILKMIKICNKVMKKYIEDSIIFKKTFYLIILKIRDFIKGKLKINIITKKVFNKNIGLKIAFLGQDGAGKSTVSSDIKKWLNWKIECKRFYLGSGEHYFSIEKSIKEKINGKKGKIFKLLNAYLTIKDYVNLSKKTYITLVKAEKYVKNGGIAIFDRYPQMKFYGINDGPKLRENYLNKTDNNFIKKFILKNAKKEEKYLEKAVKMVPDLVFKLILPVEESIRRKPEEDINLIEKKSEIIKKLNFEGAQIEIVNATQDYNDEIIGVKNIIWQKIQRL